LADTDDVKADDASVTPEAETDAADTATNATDDAPSDDADETETEANEADGDDGEGDDEPRPKRKRPGRLERRLARLEAENSVYRQQMVEQAQAAPARQPQPPKQAPKFEDFESIDDYVAAAVEHGTNAKIEAARFEARQRANETSRQRQERETVEKRQAWVTKGDGLLDGFADIIADEDVAMTPVMADALVEADNGHAAAFYLVENPDESERISKLTPTGQAMAIARLAAKATLPGKKRTKAPTPARTLAGGSKATTDPSKMSNEEYFAYRNKQLKAG
jgi:hypothetical protein